LRQKNGGVAEPWRPFSGTLGWGKDLQLCLFFNQNKQSVWMRRFDGLIFIADWGIPHGKKPAFALYCEESVDALKNYSGSPDVWSTNPDCWLHGAIRSTQVLEADQR
jgi:hypothetical protein